MDLFTIDNAARKWYQIILWWEIRRVLYNFIMLLAGMASFYIGYVTLPLLYIVIGMCLNFIYTLGWISELTLSNSVSQEKKRQYAPKAFIIILVFSLVIVFGFSLFLVLR